MLSILRMLLNIKFQDEPSLAMWLPCWTVSVACPRPGGDTAYACRARPEAWLRLVLCYLELVFFVLGIREQLMAQTEHDLIENATYSH